MQTQMKYHLRVSLCSSLRYIKIHIAIGVCTSSYQYIRTVIRYGQGKTDSISETKGDVK
jgi:hypothetical protein